MKPAPIKHSSWVVGVQGDGKNRKYLLGKRAKGANNSGQWGFFGGTNDPGETPQEAGHREFREESGIPINHSLHMGTHKTKAKHNHFFLTHFPTEVEPKNLDKKETEKHAWRTRSQIRRMNLHSSAQIYFHKILPAKLAAKAAKRKVTAANDLPYGYWIDEKGTLHPVEFEEHLLFIEQKFNTSDPFIAIQNGWIRVGFMDKEVFLQIETNNISPKAANSLLNLCKDHSFSEYHVDVESFENKNLNVSKHISKVFKDFEFNKFVRFINQNINKNIKTIAKIVPMNDPEGHYEHHGIKYDQANGLGQVPFKPRGKLPWFFGAYEA